MILLGWFLSVPLLMYLSLAARKPRVQMWLGLFAVAEFLLLLWWYPQGY